MKEFFDQLLTKILSYFVFILILLFISVCVMTGEFPPKIQSIRTQYQNLVELKKNSMILMKAASTRLKAAEEAEAAAQTHSGQQAQLAEALAGLQKQDSRLMKDNDFSQDIGEIRREQVRLKSQIDFIIQQNNEIIKLLTKQP